MRAMRRPARGRAVALFLAAVAGAEVAPAAAGDSAVVLAYHRFGETAHPSTNIRLAQFDAHIETLVRGGYKVLPLPEIVAAIRERRALPERAVAITIDDAFLSVYAEAWPRLERAGLPFTLFVVTDPIDRGYRGHMRWDQIRRMARAGVTIGNHTASHLHMADADPARNAGEIARSNARFAAELGASPRLFAYPYGEYSLAVRRTVEEAGFDAAFGQQSGVVSAAADRYALPRFALNEAHGALDRFRLAIDTLPLPMRDLSPADPLLRPGGNPPLLAFTVTGPARRGLRALACYASGQPKPAIERAAGGRVIVRLAQAFPAGRSRVNCTMPAGGGRWRWLGFQFYLP